MSAFQLGHLVGTLLMPLIFMVIIGGIYYLIKRPDKPFWKVVFSRWVIVAGIVLFLLGLVGRFQNFQAQQNSHTYPQSAVQNFANACVENAGKAIPQEVATKICACSIEEIQKQYTFGEFMRTEQEMEKSGQISSEVRSLITGCAQKVISEGKAGKSQGGN